MLSASVRMPFVASPLSHSNAEPRLSDAKSQHKRIGFDAKTTFPTANAPVQRLEGMQSSAGIGAGNSGGGSSLPSGLRAGVEGLSGMPMGDVRVHYNSSQPAKLNALAFAKGNNIHVGPGQEKHLPHEAWHVVQQKQGRVRPTAQLKGIGLNDDTQLEREADEMGAKAQRWTVNTAPAETTAHTQQAKPAVMQHKSNVVQRAVGFEFETGYPIVGLLADSDEAALYTVKNVPIWNGHGWHAVSDSGGLEFVTDPFAESVSGLEDLIAALHEMSAFAMRVERMLADAAKVKAARGIRENLAVRELWWNLPTIKMLNVKGADRPSLGMQQLSAESTVNYVNDAELYLANTREGMEAAPQMTAGIKFAELGKLFGKISGGQPEDAYKYEGEAAIAGRFPADNAIMRRAAASVQAAAKDNKFSASSAFGGFLHLVYLYLIYPQALYEETGEAAPYPKDMPLLGRTDMGRLAQATIETEAERAFFEEPALLLYYAGIRGSLSSALFPAGYSNQGRPTAGPTRSEWLAELRSGEDWFNKIENGARCGGQTAMGSLGFGSREGGEADGTPDRAIVELRRLAGPVHAEHWPTQAKLWYMLAVKTNSL